MKKLLLVCAVTVIYILHQDFWNWATAQPVVFGIFPAGLFYHVCYTIAVTVLMWVLVRYAWPTDLEKEAAGEESEMASVAGGEGSGEASRI